MKIHERIITISLLFSLGFPAHIKIPFISKHAFEIKSQLELGFEVSFKHYKEHKRLY